MSDTSTSRSRRAVVGTSAGALGLAIVALLSACGGSSTGSTSSAAAAPSGAPTGGAAQGGAGGAGGPAASGLIADTDGSTLQVQSQQNGQVAVTYSTSTTFTQQAKVASTTIKAGDCVTAMSSSADASGTSFTATTVRVSQAVDGECTGGFGGGGFGGGTRPSGAPTGGMPSGAPSGAPTGAFPSGANRMGTVASGSVVSVSGSTLVVAARQFTMGAAATPSAGSTPTTTNETVTLDASTTITAEQDATAAAATVGRCATAQGDTDSSGAVTATSIALSDAVDGACTGGFGGGFRGGPGAGAETGDGNG